jgi:hypothetical protein
MQEQPLSTAAEAAEHVSRPGILSCITSETAYHVDCAHVRMVSDIIQTSTVQGPGKRPKLGEDDHHPTSTPTAVQTPSKGANAKTETSVLFSIDSKPGALQEALLIFKVRLECLAF